MQSIQNQYARWFNRSRDRDGPLHRGRFRSKRVTTIGYRRQLVRYIDANPVEADIVETAALYSHGSAARYAQADGPRWLMRDWIESCVLAATNTTSYQPRDYTRVFGGPISSRLVRLIEKRLAMPGQVEDPLDDLLHAAPEHVVEWMRVRAALADGTNIGLPVCDVDDLADVIDEARRRQGAWTMSFAGGSTDVWDQLHIALLREICGTTWREAGMRLRLSTAAAWRAYQRHARALVEDREYGLRAAGIVATALERTSPQPSVRVKQSALARVCQPD